jgi:glycosyltransferase involved in cell wall biosynthesis
MTPRFSICMPTYKRAALLPACFAAFSAQTYRDFEVVIVDDGSPDNTPEVLAQLTAAADFPVRAVRVTNGGRGRALNRALDEATGEFILFMDDDDLLDPQGLERLSAAWESIPALLRDTYCGVAGLCTYPDGRLIGDQYPTDHFDSDFFALREVLGIRGDKKEAVRRSCIGSWRFTVFGTERRAPTASLWFHLSTMYRARFVNQVVAIKDYHPEGMSANLRRIRVKSALSTSAFYETVLREHAQMPFAVRVRYLANLRRFRGHSGASGWPEPLQAQPMAARMVGALVGRVAYHVDRALLARAS